MTHDHGRAAELACGVVNANGIGFSYLEAGEGPLVLCLHGFPDCPITFAELLPALADAGFHAVAPFMRGYAPTSSAPDGRYDRLAVASDAIALVERLSENGAFLVGHDWGAVAALGAAALAPARVQAVVTIGIAHPAVLATRQSTPYDVAKSMWHAWFFQTAAAEATVSAEDFQFIDRWWGDASPSWRPDPRHLESVKDSFRVPGVTEAALAYYRQLLGAGEHDARIADLFAAPTPVPALAFFGDEDRPGLSLLFDSMDSWFCAGLEKVMLNGAGHFLHCEQPAVVNQAIVRFLHRTTRDRPR